jgi:uncharacterized membrane protein
MIAATLLVAVVVHRVSVFFLPRLIMLRTMARITKLAGIVLFRALIDDETHIAEIDAARHYAACESYKAG